MSIQTLLPAGMIDLLPPHADFEADVVERLMAAFARFGYERVKPPLIEFEDSLLAGPGAALTSQTFRLMDPVSQRMLALRPDFTMQVARIATERLSGSPRPLRLSYAGQVVRMSGSNLRQARQVGQVGAEMIAAPAPGGDAEIILMAAEALTDLGVRNLKVDLGIPALVPALLAEARLDRRSWQRLRTALDRKDVAGVRAHATSLGPGTVAALTGLVTLAGPAEPALAALNTLDLPEEAGVQRAALAEVIETLRESEPELSLSIDAVENRGFEYHSGVTFALFAPGVRSELGRGGRYRAGHAEGHGTDPQDPRGEPATGITLFMDVVLEAVPPPERQRGRVLLPKGATPRDAKDLREQGWVTVAGFKEGKESHSEARALSCTHVLVDGRPQLVTVDKE